MPNTDLPTIDLELLAGITGGTQPPTPFPKPAPCDFCPPGTKQLPKPPPCDFCLPPQRDTFPADAPKQI